MPFVQLCSPARCWHSGPHVSSGLSVFPLLFALLIWIGSVCSALWASVLLFLSLETSILVAACVTPPLWSVILSSWFPPDLALESSPAVSQVYLAVSSLGPIDSEYRDQPVKEESPDRQKTWHCICRLLGLCPFDCATVFCFEFPIVFCPVTMR